MGLLDTELDPQELKRQQLAAMLMGLSGGLLGARRGQELQGLGQGLLGGYAGAQNVRGDLLRQQALQMKMRGESLDYDTKKMQYDDQTLLRQQEADFQRRRMGGAPSQGPAAGAQSATAFGMADRSLGMPPSLPPTQQPVAPQMGQEPDRRAVAKQYQDAANYWAQQSGEGAARKAQFYQDAATKAMPQLKEQKTITQNGKRVLLNLYVDGSHEILTDVGPDLEKLHTTDNGQYAGIGQDPFSGEVRFPGIKKEPTPGEMLSNDIAKGNLKVAQGNLGVAQYNATKPQYDAERGGFVAPPSPKGGPSFTPVPGVQPKDQTPASLKEKIAQNNVTLSSIDKALTGLQTNPDAVGVPANILPDSVMSRFDPKGVDLRATIAGIGGQKFHDLSGAAISVSEAGRLQPYIPQVGDPPAAAAAKLRNLRREVQAMNQELSQGRSIAEVAAPRGNGKFKVERLD